MKVKAWARVFTVNKLALILLLAFTLSGCDTFANRTPQPLPTVVLGSSAVSTQVSPQGSGGGGIAASAIVVPAQEAQLAFALAGRVEAISAAVGQQVQSGQVLARLAGDEQLQAALSGAELEVLSAQQALEDLEKSTSIKIAQAQTALQDAEKALDNLQNPSQTAIAQAQTAVIDAQKAVDDAQKAVDKLGYRRASDEQLAAARASYLLAQEKVDRLQQIYNGTPGSSDEDAGKALALSNLDAAKYERNKALAALNWYLGKPTQAEIDEKTTALALAKGQLADAQAALEELTSPTAEDVALAKATVEDAQQTLDDLKAGPESRQVALLQARLKSAQDQAEAARASLDNLELKAPFAGTVGKMEVQIGEWAMPGQPVLVLVDLEHLQVETTDLSERDVPQIEAGQPVTVSFKALGQDATGQVSVISPLADTLGGDVVYKVTVQLDAIPAGLRAGMSADVRFGADP